MKTLEQKRDEAVIRQQAYDALTTEQKIERLDRAFGVGKGAVRERARLSAPKEIAPAAIPCIADAPTETKKRGKPSRRNLKREAEATKNSKE